MILQISNVDWFNWAVLLVQSQLISAGNTCVSEASDSASKCWAYCQLGHRSN